MNKLKDLINKKNNSTNYKSKKDLTLEIAIIYFENRDFPKSFDEYQELLKLAEDDLSLQAQANRQMGECLLEMEKPKEAITYVTNYLKISNQIGDLLEIQRAYVTMGRCYLDQATFSKNPTMKNAAAMRSDNCFRKSLEFCQKISDDPQMKKNFKSSSSSKSIKSESAFKLEIAEMKSVSLYNLGLVSREQTDNKAKLNAERYFSQCCSVCINNKLYDMFLQSTMQLVDMKYIQSSRLSDANNKTDCQAIIADALKIVRDCLNKLFDVPFSSSMKKLRRDIQEMEALCLIVAGKLRKAAKKYRNLMKRSPINKSDFQMKMNCVICLQKKLEDLKEQRSKKKELIYIAMLYQDLNMPMLALPYYRSAIKLMENIKDSDNKKLVNRLVTVNELVGCHKDNIVWLENKLNDCVSADSHCYVIKKLLNSYLLSGLAFEKYDKIISLVAQLDSHALLTDKYPTQVSTAEFIVKLYEELNNVSLKNELVKAKEKLERLHSNDRRNNDNNEEEEDNDEDNDDENESDFSELELNEDDINDTILSSDSDVDLRQLTESQTEELQAVGKRLKSRDDKSFIKRNEKGETLLHVAAISGNYKQVKKLVEQMNHPVDIEDTAGWTPLSDAANCGRTKIVDYLLNKGANINHTGAPQDRSTAVMEAVSGGHIDTAILLIGRNGDLWHKNRLDQNLGDIVDDWRQRCIEANEYGETEAREYKRIMILIKKTLGDDYIKWCRERKAGRISSNVNTNNSGNDVNARQTTQSNTIPVYNRRALPQDDDCISDCISDKEGELVDENHEVEEEIGVIEQYKNVMESLKSTTNKIMTSQDNNEQTNNEDVGYVIGDDWLENDMPNYNQRSNKYTKQLDYGAYVRCNRKRGSEVIQDDDNDKRKCRIVASKKVALSECSNNNTSTIIQPGSSYSDNLSTQCDDVLSISYTDLFADDFNDGDDINDDDESTYSSSPNTYIANVDIIISSSPNTCLTNTNSIISSSPNTYIANINSIISSSPNTYIANINSIISSSNNTNPVNTDSIISSSPSTYPFNANSIISSSSNTYPFNANSIISSSSNTYPFNTNSIISSSPNTYPINNNNNSSISCAVNTNTNVNSVTLPSTIIVVYRSVSMIIPLKEGCTVLWLINETIRRYCHQISSQLLIFADNIRISTQDGNLLFPSDPLMNILIDLGPGLIKLFATDTKYLYNKQLSCGLSTSSFLCHHADTLQEIDLSCNDISGPALSQLFDDIRHNSFNNVKIVNLSGNPIGSNNFNVLSFVKKYLLPIFPFIEILKMNECEISNFSEDNEDNEDNNNNCLQPLLKQLHLSNNPINFHRENSHNQFWKLIGNCLRNLYLQGCGRLLEHQFANNNNNNSFHNNSSPVQFLTSIVDLILESPIKLDYLDISDCSIDQDCINQINKLFFCKNSTISFISCHDNTKIRNSVSNWLDLVYIINSPWSKITTLSIDMPQIFHQDELEKCIYVIQSKINTALGNKLRGIHLRIDGQMIHHIDYAIQQQGYTRLSKDYIKIALLDQEKYPQPELMSIHYSKCFVLSIIDCFRDRDGNDQVLVNFDNDFLKIVSSVTD